MLVLEPSVAWRVFEFLVLVAAVFLVIATVVALVGNSLEPDDDAPIPSRPVPTPRPRDSEALRTAADVREVPAVRVRITGMDGRRSAGRTVLPYPSRDETIGRDQFRGARARSIAQMQGERR